MVHTIIIGIVITIILSLCALHGHLQPETQSSSCSSAVNSKEGALFDGNTMDGTIDSLSDDILQYLWDSTDFTSVGITLFSCKGIASKKLFWSEIILVPLEEKNENVT